MLGVLPLSLLMGSFTSCADFLEIEPQNVVTLEQFWNEEADVVNSIAGCYSALQSDACISRMMIWGEFRSENIINRGDIPRDINLQRILEETLAANNGYTDWTCFYDIINRCNIIQHYAPGVAEKDPSYSQTELKAHMAETTALRSLCYFYLIRTFRNVPYTEEPYLDDAREMVVPAESFDVVLDKLIASLESVKNLAIVYYPEGTTGLSQYYQTARITQLSIYAMLCEMYLWKQDYEKCKYYADLVIDFKKQYVKDHNKVAVDYSDFNGYPLTTCKANSGNGWYGRAFNSLFVTNNDPESIFELAFVKNNKNMASNAPITRFYGGANGATIFLGWVKPTEFLESEAKNINNSTLYKSKYDGRRYENFFRRNGEVLAVNKYTVETGNILPSPSNQSTFNTYIFGERYSYEDKNNAIISNNKSNWIIYRLSDILLLKAEALAMQIQAGSETLSDEDQKKLTEAFLLCNSVNKRSLYEDTPKDTLKLGDYKTQDDILNLVYEERHRELMFEGKRWYDLVRRSLREGNTNYIRENVSRKSDKNSSQIDNFLMRMDAIFWPYNLDETKVNTLLHQNPAFGSGENSSMEKS